MGETSDRLKIAGFHLTLAELQLGAALTDAERDEALYWVNAARRRIEEIGDLAGDLGAVGFPPLPDEASRKSKGEQ